MSIETSIETRHGVARFTRAALGAVAALTLTATAAWSQAYGIYSMPAGTLSHTTASAIAKVLKEKGGMNMLVQPTAGETTLLPLLARGEGDLGIANIFETEIAVKAYPDLRVVGSLHSLRGAFWVRKDSPMKTVADLKGKRVVLGFSAMRTIDPLVKAILATGGLTEADIKPVLVPNVVRGAEDFANGSADMFFFAFGAAKVREVDATVGGIRALTIPKEGMAAAQKIVPEGYLTPAAPSPFFVGVEQPMEVYTWDNMLLTNAKVKDEVVYKMIEVMEANKSELVAVQPALRDFDAKKLYKTYNIPYHPGALKYFKDHKIEAMKVQ
ncbi:TAXI family TRAP transporter solute-binding subunit [Pseudolabrys sp. FHR47]|uniref:TAXI family TRAP transporter solute-binding subunit n=1 Tax=Pseudolabrys sp. FHR47 TaxID=2562284 RepID=UPI0010BED6A0|nr:TAXI family TRAP transporter solute-binding subunit [Pseudolabrys sp. FHR47]